MTADHVQRVLLNHTVDTRDPVADRAARRASQGINVGPGLIEVVAGEYDALLGQPDVELVRRLARGRGQIQGDAGDLQGHPLFRKRMRRCNPDRL